MSDFSIYSDITISDGLSTRKWLETRLSLFLFHIRNYYMYGEMQKIGIQLFLLNQTHLSQGQSFISAILKSTLSFQYANVFLSVTWLILPISYCLREGRIFGNFTHTIWNISPWMVGEMINIDNWIACSQKKAFFFDNIFSACPIYLWSQDKTQAHDNCRPCCCAATDDSNNCGKVAAVAICTGVSWTWKERTFFTRGPFIQKSDLYVLYVL